MQVIFKDNLTTLILGDSKEVCKGWSLRQDHGIKNAVMITDPVWPDVPKGLLNGWENPYELAKKVFWELRNKCKAMVVHLGQFSDPRFTRAIPSSFEFYTTVLCKYGKTSFHGRKTRDAELAYVFGKPDPPVMKVHPGMIVYAYNCTEQKKETRTIHPCPRRLQHVRGLITHFARKSVVIDPFCGGGTTLIAAREMGIPALGIEIDPEYAYDVKRQIEQMNNIFTASAAQ